MIFAIKLYVFITYFGAIFFLLFSCSYWRSKYINNYTYIVNFSITAHSVI